MDEFVLHIWTTDKTGSVSTYAVKGATWKKFIANLSLRLTAIRFIRRLIKGEKVDLLFSKPGNKPAIAPPAPNSNHFMECCTRYGLSAREIDVAALMVKGNSDKLIGELLHIGYDCVNAHVQHIYTKVNVHSRSELLLKFNENPAPVPVPVECLIKYAGQFLNSMTVSALYSLSA